MRNPNWHRDELILALDLYFNPYLRSIDSSNSLVIELSELLNRLPIFNDRQSFERFRNPNGVSLKLSNFLAIDPNHSGKGMSRGSKLDREIFFEFFQDRPRLIALAKAIKEVATNDKLNFQLRTIDADEFGILDSVQEGQVLYKLHKYRERNQKIIAAKKESVYNRTGKLDCEVCGFNFEETYGDLGKGFIECHHTIPLSTYENSFKTKISDLALVCSNCHRMLHKNSNNLTVEQLRLKLQHHTRDA